MNSERRTEALKLLQRWQSEIPDRLIGFERLQLISTLIEERFTENDRAILEQYFNQVLLELRVWGASDVEFGGIGSGGRIWARKDGHKAPVENSDEISDTSAGILLQNLLTRLQRETLLKNRNLDFSYTFTDDNNTMIRFRADAYFEMGTLAANFRIIDTKLRSIESYGLSPSTLRVLNLEHTKEGLILVTGITGSGKSSTLDAIIDFNNSTIGGHIVVISSPIEFIHSSKRCLVRHREVGKDTNSFKSGIVEALRQDPDIIVVGEMRDPETIVAALEAADSGHKVISTLHTSSAVESIERIIAETPAIEQERVRLRLAAILRCVISQKLAPAMNGGRVLAKEVMVVTPSIQAAIKNNNTEEVYQMITEGKKYGMCTMEQDLKRLSSVNRISIQTAENFANNKRMMQQLLQAV